MTNPHDLLLTPLARRALLSLQGGSGKAVGVFSGRVWITEEGVPDDHVLGPGDSMALRRPGLVIVEGLQDSQVILFDTGATAAGDPLVQGVADDHLPDGNAAGIAAGAASPKASARAPSHGAGHPAGGGIDDVGAKSLRGATGTGGARATGAPPRLSLAAYERIAREMRRQAMADAVQRLVRAMGRLLPRGATPPPALPGRGRPALAWQPPR
jgi:Protein of unknown function (DUF2917)